MEGVEFRRVQGRVQLHGQQRNLACPPNIYGIGKEVVAPAAAAWRLPGGCAGGVTGTKGGVAGGGGRAVA